MPISFLPDLPMNIIAIALGVVFFAAIVQSTTGMGFGQVAAPLLLLIHPDFVPVPILFMGMSVAALNSVGRRKDIVWKELGVAVSARLIGAVLAGFIMTIMVGTREFSLLFAALILLAVGLSLGKYKFRPTAKTLIIAGGASGFMGTITSVGAPPMGIAYQHNPAPETRATLNAFFAMGAFASLVVLGGFNLLHWYQLGLAFILAPALIMGTWVSKYLTSFVDKRFRTFILLICVCSACAVIWDALT